MTEFLKTLPGDLERLALDARDAVFDPANRTASSLPDLEARIRELARRSAAAAPLPLPTIGFDRPANVYVVSELYQAGGHRVLLEQMIGARPRERHIVLFSGAMRNSLDYSERRMREAGAFPVRPDATLALHDCYLWLRQKLATLAAQRIILLHHPEDVIAAAAAWEILPRYGRKLYLVRHSDTRPTLGAEMLEATHLTIRPEQAASVTAAHPGLVCHTLPLALSVPKASTRLLETGFFRGGAFVTSTAGGDHKFNPDGPLAFGEIIAGIILASRGRHVHLGPVTDSLKESAYQALESARISADRLLFTGEVTSVAAALTTHGADLFIASFPIGGGLTVSEAASAGVPIAVFDAEGSRGRRYISGSGHRPPKSLVWHKPDDLFSFLRADADNDSLHEMARSSVEWYDHTLSPARFSARLAAIIAVTEQRARGRMADQRERIIAQVFDPEFYLARYEDVARAGIDPCEHFLRHGDAEGRSPTSLFDAAHYLSQLSKGERTIAAPSPVTHYVLRGEPRGLSPHPLFDPVLCGMTLAPRERTTSVLGDYLAAKQPARAHTFFDDEHYTRHRIPINDRATSPLAHFLETGAGLATPPHPLIDMRRMGVAPLRALLEYVGKGAPTLDERRPDPLFDPVHFCGGNPAPWATAAPNLLWAHLIEGNRRDANPHRFVSIGHMARSDSDVFVRARSVLESLASGSFAGDTHPLVSAAHIRRQAPWLRDSQLHPTRYFLDYGAAHNVDPHPFFSVQFYLYNNPDVLRSSMNPLLHYLEAGQFENRIPHPFFDGAYYYQAYLRGQADVRPEPLTHYIQTGAGAFSPVQPHNTETDAVRSRMAGVLFRQDDDAGAAAMLLGALHPDRAARHPTLICEVRTVTDDLSETEKTISADAQRIAVSRPAVVHTTHIAPASGSYACDAQYAARCRNVTVIGGSDGIILEDGRLFDPGLAHFDPDTMRVKENGPLVEFDAGCSRALLRRHRLSERIPSGILACGTYSHNYYHFLLEIVPRALAADTIAPPDTPVLADDHMPTQHFQILRHLFPHRRIRRLFRAFSYTVDDLYVSNMTNVVHDAADADSAPVDAVRYHPAILRQLNAIGRQYRDDSAPRKVFFRRESTVRRMLNAPAIEAALRLRGFEIVQCDRISFAEQVRLAANADIIVAQSGAHLANIVFARPGTRVFALYSNTPGTNYYLWDGIGRPLGLDVVNVAGWRIAGFTPQGISRTHEDFTLPEENLLPFLPLVDDDGVPALPDDLRGCLDALYAANTEADTITGAWTIIASNTPDGFEARLAALRARAGARLESADDREVAGILDHPFFADHGRNIRSGLAALADHVPDEKRLLTRLRKAFDAFVATSARPENPEPGVQTPEPEEEAREVAAERLLALVMLYVPAYRMPLPATVSTLPTRIVWRYISWLTAPPFLFRKGDDAAYTEYCARLLQWFGEQLSGEARTAVKALLYRAASDIDLGLLVVIDRPLVAVNAARNRLLERFAPAAPPTRRTPRPGNGTGGRRRVGILCRTFDMGPDSEAIVSFFRAFDPSRYEIYAYSVGFRDRVVSADHEFAARFDTVIGHRRLLEGGPHEIRARILADDLDVFLLANATTYGLRAQELALYHRVAPVQMVLNSHVPMPPGFAAFDGYITGRSDRPETAVPQADYAERLIRADGPVICYLNSLKPQHAPLFDRAAIGLAEDDVVLMNAGSLSKLRYECLRAMMLPLRETPHARLLLAPYNPGWVARSQAFAFNRQITEMARELAIDPSRIVVMGELSVAEAESALALCDIYLNPFPHGGATMTHLALINGKPPVTLRRRSTRSIDQFLIGSLGLHELLASSEAHYAKIASRLAREPRLRETVSERILEAVRNPPFVDNQTYSLAMQALIGDALENFSGGTGKTKSGQMKNGPESE